MWSVIFLNLKPSLWTSLKHYNRTMAVNDVIAGILVGIIAIPLSIALAIASGATPETGLWTAALAGFVVSLLGGSPVQISGPTGAFVVIVYGIIQQYGYTGLITATFMAGVMMVSLGFGRAGNMIKFIPYPITIGFTAGIAVTLFAGQIGDFLGLAIEKMPAEFFEKLSVYAETFHTLNLHTAIIGIGSLAVILVWNRFNRYIPGSLVALVAATLTVRFTGWNVATIGSRFGELSASLPPLVFPSLDYATISGLFGPAISIAVLGSMESLLSAVVADGMTGQKHNSNMELVAQGAGNVASALFGGLPVTGAIARTAANVRSGGRTSIAGMVHAVTVLCCTLIFMPYVKLVPMTALAAILFTVCYNMIERRSIREVFRAPKSDISVMIITFVMTVVFDLVVAIQAGLVMAMLLFIKRMMDVTNIKDITDEALVFDERDADLLPKELKGKVIVYRLQGPFFFGAANSFLNVENSLEHGVKAIIFDMKGAEAIDATGMHALLVFLHTCRKRNVEFFLVGAKEQPMKAMEKGKILAMINDKHIYATKAEAIQYIKSVQQHLIHMDEHTHHWHKLHKAPASGNHQEKP
jgi:SulP family sulfate permease